MKKENVILEQGNYRIIEVLDDMYDIQDLMGDYYNPDVNKDIKPEELKEQELAFIRKVELDGVYGYILQKWNPEVGIGWEHVDSCFGFVGNHADENHYIVDEFKAQIA